MVAHISDQVLTIQGMAVPRLGLGTYELKGEACAYAVRHALNIGYRHIDITKSYDNNAYVLLD